VHIGNILIPPDPHSSSESANVIFVDFGASAVISLKWAPYSLDSCKEPKKEKKNQRLKLE